MTNETGIITVEPQLLVVEKSEVLTSTSRDGDFVHATQTMSADVDFKNVSRLWYDQTISFDDGREIMAKQRQEREDFELPVEEIDFTAKDDGVYVVIADREFKPTPHAMVHLCKWFETPSTMATFYGNAPNSGKFKRDEQDYDLICYAFENGRRRIKDKKKLLLRTYKDGTLRSVMSDGYSIVDNDWYLDLLSHLIPGGRLSHWRGDADTIYGNVIIPDSIRAETDSDYGGMLSLSNCEIGKRVISQTPSIFRAICMNGCIWGQTKGEVYSKRHKGINLEDETARIKANINNQIPLMAPKVNELLITRKWKMEAEARNVFAAIQQMAKITPIVAADVAAMWIEQGQDKTAFGFIDAITRASQLQTPVDGVLLDTFSAGLLSMKIWQNVNHIAKGLDDKQVMKNLNISA
jgi:hypothetical protein